MVQYKTQKQKATDFLNWIIEIKSDGQWYKLDSFLAKASIEKGFKKKMIMEMLEDLEVLGKVKINREINEILFISNMEEREKIEKEVDSVLKNVKTE